MAMARKNAARSASDAPPVAEACLGGVRVLSSEGVLEGGCGRGVEGEGRRTIFHRDKGAGAADLGRGLGLSGLARQKPALGGDEHGLGRQAVRGRGQGRSGDGRALRRLGGGFKLGQLLTQRCDFGFLPPALLRQGLGVVLHGVEQDRRENQDDEDHGHDHVGHGVHEPGPVVLLAFLGRSSHYIDPSSPSSALS